MLNDADRQRIAETVAKAEAATTGEIVCVLAREVSNYREVPLGWAAAAALIIPPAAVWLGFSPWLLLPEGGGWSVGHVSAQTWVIPSVVTAYSLLQAAIFVLVAFLVWIPQVRRLLTPGTLKRHRVHKAALEQFLATGLHTTGGRTGVVIFASEHDRKVEILADDLIHEKVGKDVWDAATQAVVESVRRGRAADGFVRAVEICGEALARHFPATGGRKNELPDLPIEL